MYLLHRTKCLAARQESLNAKEKDKYETTRSIQKTRRKGGQTREQRAYTTEKSNKFRGMILGAREKKLYLQAYSSLENMILETIREDYPKNDMGRCSTLSGEGIRF